MSERRITVDLGTLRSIPALEIDPTKKYIFLVDPRRFDMRVFENCELGIDALVIPVIPGEHDDSEAVSEAIA